MATTSKIELREDFDDRLAEAVRQYGVWTMVAGMTPRQRWCRAWESARAGNWPVINHEIPINAIDAAPLNPESPSFQEATASILRKIAASFGVPAHLFTPDHELRTPPAVIAQRPARDGLWTPSDEASDG